MASSPMCSTEILSVRDLVLPDFGIEDDPAEFLKHGRLFPDIQNLERASLHLANHMGPVAFPTETVYGLGGDATDSKSVRGIFAAKNRPADNPLIVHVSCLSQLRKLLGGPLPDVYETLVAKYWPGPLTIILPLPQPSPLAPEVTHNKDTFGVRMPSSSLARLFIAMTDKPVAAPSANTSTRPSPTTAQHVYDDMNGRIEIILDGGPCYVGVESTVVDGLSDPPAVLRPGGIGIEQIRALGGKWADVTIGYQDRQQHMGADSGDVPRAPGMKYKHYSPRARVFLFEAGVDGVRLINKIHQIVALGFRGRVGIVSDRADNWDGFLTCRPLPPQAPEEHGASPSAPTQPQPTTQLVVSGTMNIGNQLIEGYALKMGSSAIEFARGLFSALRDLDTLGCGAIMIEGISDTDGDLAAAVMNRLRKAAEEVIDVA